MLVAVHPFYGTLISLITIYTQKVASFMKESYNTGKAMLYDPYMQCINWAYSMIYDEDWVFVASDENLCKVAELMNFKAINPLKHESIG